jgi:hypothetical protein
LIPLVYRANVGVLTRRITEIRWCSIVSNVGFQILGWISVGNIG